MVPPRYPRTLGDVLALGSLLRAPELKAHDENAMTARPKELLHSLVLFKIAIVALEIAPRRSEHMNES